MLEFLNRAALSVSSLAILVMALIGGLDVLGVVLLEQPFPATYEVTELLMVPVVFLAISSLQARRMNIAVDVLTARMTPRSQRRLDAFAILLGGIFFGLVAWQGWAMALDSLEVREYSQGAYRIPVYPFKLAFALGASLVVIQYAKDLVSHRRPS